MRYCDLGVSILVLLFVLPASSRAERRQATATLLSAEIDPPSCPPGFESRLTLRWDAEPMGRDLTVFVHCIGADGKMAFQADHAPATPMSSWSGRVQYTKKIYVPIGTPDGDYRVVVGLYDRRSGQRPVLKTGPQITALEGNAYQVGLLKVDSHAPIPKLPPPTLDLRDYTLTFHDEFDDLSVSAAGPGTRWFTATKESFSDARFVEEKDGFPFTVDRGVLRIEAAKRNGTWCSGILASVNPRGEGFAQKFGYFEMRAKFPESPGMWPAFWLLGQPSLNDRTCPNPEIDVVEYYGALPNLVMSTLHIWRPGGRHWAEGDSIAAAGLTDGFHTYGVMVDQTHITWYFDGIETQRQKTPQEAKVPLYLLVNLGLGGGWPIDKAVNPSYMYVDYVRVYARKPGGGAEPR